MLAGWHSRGAGGVGGGEVSLVANYTDHVFGSATITLPSSGVVGDVAIIACTGVTGYGDTLPSGWTQITYTNRTDSYRQFQRLIYKVLAVEDLGATVTTAPTALAASYGQTYLVTFTPSFPVTTVIISSVDVDQNTGSPIPTRTKNTSVYDPPNIVFTAASSYGGALGVVFGGTFWDVNFVDNNTVVSLGVAYEVQDDANTDRDVTPTISGQSRICHSFVLNIS